LEPCRAATMQTSPNGSLLAAAIEIERESLADGIEEGA
jgi:hypothetical protein